MKLVLEDVKTIAGYALREAVRRKVLVVVVVLTICFLALYAFGTQQAFNEVAVSDGGGISGLEEEVLTGSTLLGLAMFVTLFLGTVLAVFVTLNAVRGDAERGLLQPLVVRPVGRTTLLLARFLAAAAVCVVYVQIVYWSAVALTQATGGYYPGNAIAGAVSLAAAVTIIVALALLGTTLLSSTANGIAIFMVFGAGLVAGLLGQIGEAVQSGTLDDVSRVASWLLPFEALYQAGLSSLTADTTGVTGLVLNLGPFGGAEAGGPLLWVWSLVYLAAVGAVARHVFARRDL